MKKSYEIDMTKGSIFPKIVSFSFPLMLTGMLQLLFNSADVIVVGRFVGHKAMAAVGSTGTVVSPRESFPWACHGSQRLHCTKRRCRKTKRHGRSIIYGILRGNFIRSSRFFSGKLHHTSHAYSDCHSR